MKKQFGKKLMLNKSTVTNLNGKDMNNLRGGLTAAGGCNTEDECTRPKYCETYQRACGTGAPTQTCNTMTDCPSVWC